MPREHLPVAMNKIFVVYAAKIVPSTLSIHSLIVPRMISSQKVCLALILFHFFLLNSGFELEIQLRVAIAMKRMIRNVSNVLANDKAINSIFQTILLRIVPCCRRTESGLFNSVIELQQRLERQCNVINENGIIGADSMATVITLFTLHRHTTIHSHQSQSSGKIRTLFFDSIHSQSIFTFIPIRLWLGLPTHRDPLLIVAVKWTLNDNNR